ncbi:hypothetical protein GF339_00225 [candidate division KSB3 bacterium]|uniref:Uncharacterized protein n=1 Tax=candidate division KSB3 bacterium TaxID=2044937 RepID=A0A9D5JRK4_9BACT|nr:hypothetical protein [candidate division KSB3 bacterium]MBD3322974.1 hypothetical protein [candidate division KSB3 bacterium]
MRSHRTMGYGLRKYALWLLSLVLAISCLALLTYYWFGLPSHKLPLQQDLASLLPSSPLAYLQCSDLQLQVEQFAQSPFLQSPFVTHLTNAPWWEEFAQAFQDSWESLLIDPMHILGTEAAFGLYPREEGDLLPPVIFISRIDRIAKIAERLLYLFDRVTGGIGMQFFQKTDGVSVYMIDQEEMLMPVYYGIIDDMGLLSTSFPVLQRTIRHILMEAPETSELAPPFHQRIQALPDEHFVTLYADLAAIVSAFQPLPTFTTEPSRQEVELPCMTLWWDMLPDQAVVQAALIPNSAEMPGEIGSEPDMGSPKKLSGRLFLDSPEAFPVSGIFAPGQFSALLNSLQALFPDQDWSHWQQRQALSQNIFAGRLECRLSETLWGTLYAVPDVFCVGEAHPPEQSRTAMQQMIASGLEEALPSIPQRAMVMQPEEEYQQTTISKVLVLLQEVFGYAVVEEVQQGASDAVLFMATSTNVLKQQMAAWRAREPHGSSHNGASDQMPVARIWSQPERLADWLDALSGTRTFGLLLPVRKYPLLHQGLPLVLQLVRSLPATVVDVEVQAHCLTFTLRTRERR